MGKKFIRVSFLDSFLFPKKHQKISREDNRISSLSTLTMRRLSRVRPRQIVPTTNVPCHSRPATAFTPLVPARHVLQVYKTPIPEQLKQHEKIQRLLKDREGSELEELYEDEVGADAHRVRPASRLTMPPKFTTAPKPNDVSDSRYIESTTSEGLEEVGIIQDWWEKPGNWGQESEFIGFAPKDKVTDSTILQVLTRQAIVESLAVLSSGNEDQLTSLWPRSDRSAFDTALAVKISVSEDGNAELSGDVKGVVSGLKWKTPEVADESSSETAPDAFYLSHDEASEMVDTWDPSWKQISLQDSRLKFAVSSQPCIFFLGIAHS
jgi:hypothetical protein